jgi:hypothetical protein
LTSLRIGLKKKKAKKKVSIRKPVGANKSGVIRFDRFSAKRNPPLRNLGGLFLSERDKKTAALAEE